jgi:hypothetical protein
MTIAGLWEMSSRNLQELKVKGGNDMHPSIDPKETLYLDPGAKPEIGDVVLFENKFGIRIAHRLMYKCAGYYFTRGDNCPVIGMPFRKDKLLGVVDGKRGAVPKRIAAELLLTLFLPQFIMYSKLFDIRKKRYFLLLTMASRYYPYTTYTKAQ